MPTTTTIVKKKTNYRRKGYRKKRRYKRKSQYAYHKLSTIGMPHNMYTYVQLKTPMFTYALGKTATSNPFFVNSQNVFVMGYNQLNPINLTLGVQPSGDPPLPELDGVFFGPNPTGNTYGNPTSPTEGQYAWSGINWWANWYTKMRITKVWAKYTIRPIQGNQLPPSGEQYSPEPFQVTFLDAKYVPSLNSPELIAGKDMDDVMSTRGAKTYTVSGQRSRPLVIKRRIDIRRLLGVKDIKDTGEDTQCLLIPNLNTQSANACLNPTVRSKVFGLVIINRRTDLYPSDVLQKYSMQIELIAKVHLSQLDRNNPRSIFSATGGVGNPSEEDPNGPHNQPPPPAQV